MRREEHLSSGYFSTATVSRCEVIPNRLGRCSTERIASSIAAGPHVLAIPGTGSVEHLVENIAAAALRLSDAELASLNAR